MSLGGAHLGSFDRRKCKGPLSEPKATGDRVPWLKEGGRGTVPIAFRFQFRPGPLAD